MNINNIIKNSMIFPLKIFILVNFVILVSILLPSTIPHNNVTCYEDNFLSILPNLCIDTLE